MLRKSSQCEFLLNCFTIRQGTLYKQPMLSYRHVSLVASSYYVLSCSSIGEKIFVLFKDCLHLWRFLFSLFYNCSFFYCLDSMCSAVRLRLSLSKYQKVLQWRSLASRNQPTSAPAQSWREIWLHPKITFEWIHLQLFTGVKMGSSSFSKFKRQTVNILRQFKSKGTFWNANVLARYQPIITAV